ncbi:MAG: DUF4080 domain-containing protein [Verrucomicrobiae bacterium]|nr:DUF4080 domain-containing protein [Verrucomicrobiae bacterium]
MPDILICSFDAKYIHASLGARCLLANLGGMRSRAGLAEFDLTCRAVEAVDAILAARPRIVGIGVYIWNVDLVTEVAELLLRIRSDIILVVGGPEVSHEMEQQRICAVADYVVAGEGEQSFAWLCGEILRGGRPEGRVIRRKAAEPVELAMPYREYVEKDVRQRVIYVEASRGCPFGCEFCLSSVDERVREFPLTLFLDEMNRLMKKGVRQFKFVDRTFNLNKERAEAVLDFFLDRQVPGLFLHFEMIPGRFPESLRARLRRFPRGMVQLEVGVQTLNPDVADRIGRRMDVPVVEENLSFLRRETGVHVHADLVAGLPGETWESFGEGFDRLVRLKPHEIQIELLKKLRGAPIRRHDEVWRMIYNPQPPYEVLQTRDMDFPMLQRLRRFSRTWDLLANSGNFVESHELLWKDGGSPFAAFLNWSEWLRRQAGRGHGIALLQLMEFYFCYLTREIGRVPGEVGPALFRDYARGGRSDKPLFLHSFAEERTCEKASRRRGAQRQERHAAGFKI